MIQQNAHGSGGVSNHILTDDPTCPLSEGRINIPCLDDSSRDSPDRTDGEVQGDQSGQLKPPVDLDMGFPAILPWEY